MDLVTDPLLFFQHEAGWRRSEIDPIGTVKAKNIAGIRLGVIHAIQSVGLSKLEVKFRPPEEVTTTTGTSAATLPAPKRRTRKIKNG